VVGVVDARGEGAGRFADGERVGIAWLRGTCGTSRFCRRGDENLCLDPRFTGWHDDGGYAEYAVVDERFAYRLPVGYDDEHAAPLLCAGIIGYRALRRSRLPRGGRLGIVGFGASAHLTAQVALFEGARVHVFTRSAAARRLALDLGVASAQDVAGPAPEPLDAAITFAPDGGVVPTALAMLDRGATLTIAGIHLTPVPRLDYDEHLFQERTLCSVTANTRADGEAFLDVAGRVPLHVTTLPFPFEQADRALDALASGNVTGVAVLRMT
jgi:propanol-preferring alcohol dehydrogenase